MSDKPYYLAYENRYHKVFEAGADRWGHSPDDESLVQALTKWVGEHQLRGKRIIEFACGEGASGEILSGLGCIYHGVDIAPSAVAKTQEALKNCPNASVALLDMVKDQVPGTYDAALDVMGFHMLVLDQDRKQYLRNAFQCLQPGAPMLFFKESYRVDALDTTVETMEEWKLLSGSDYDTPQLRATQSNGQELEVLIPLVPARAKTKKGYEQELSDAGFIFDDFAQMGINYQCPHSATFHVHKPL